MKKFRKSSFLKRIALLTVFIMVWEISFPTLAWALTGGPSQPEVQSFEPVGTTEMVDLSSGDFVYNIPLLDVGGYPINLSYHGGVEMEQEASWVGLGWNINPGVINRNLRGLPDDFKGDKVVRTFNNKTNWTVGIDYTRTKHWEIFGLKNNVGSSYTTSQVENANYCESEITNLFTKSAKSLSISLGINYNNYKGIGYSINFGGSNSKIGGLNLGYSSSNGFNIGASFSKNYGMLSSLTNNIIGGASPGVNFNSRQGLTSASLGMSALQFKKRNYSGGSVNCNFNLGEVNSTPAPQPNFHSFGATLSYAGGKVTVLGVFRQKNKFQVDFNTTKIKDKNTSYNSYGYLYQNNSGESSAKKAKTDFSRVFDEQINKSTVYMPLAQKTYDAFSASGQGTGSGIRLKESYISPVADPETDITSAYTPDIGIEFGRGGNKHLGVDVAFSFQEGTSNQWKNNNTVSDHFPKTIKNYPNWFEPVYFQSMGESVPIDKTMYNDLQGESYITAELTKRPDIGVSSSTIDNAKKQLTERAKRNQVTSYLTAANASIAGVTKKIENYPAIENNGYPEFEDGDEFPTYYSNFLANQKNLYVKTESNRVDNPYPYGYKKPHHLSEVTTLNPDGTRYVYGIPAYNYSTIEQTFAVDPGSNPNTNFSNYDGNNLSVNNSSGLDHFYLKEETPAYPHSFLLTSILSSDYVDIKQDGITDDDYGNYVKINYSKLVPKTNNSERTPLPNTPVHWRAPYNNARLQKGLETDPTDDKASIVEGTKEVWYMHTVETKDYVAEFYTSDRDDGLDASTSDYGGKGNLTSRKLDKIVLYNRYDRKQNGTGATPIKTVHFEYDYSLCKGVFNQINTDEGKLTLKKVWFSYGYIPNIEPIAPYEFIYPTSGSNSNKGYNEMYHDYWGNYQDFSSVFGGKYSSHPDDFPYVDQETSRATLDEYAASWNLKEIILPSGGRIKINYEADDYAYVQDKNAMEFFQILGFTETHSQPWANQNVLFNSTTNYNYIHFKLHSPFPTTKEQLKERYLKGNLNFMVYVKMKMNPLIYPDKEEWVKTYVELDGGENNYGIIGDHGYIRVRSMSIYKNKIKYNDDPDGDPVGVNPISRMGWEFLKENMPWEVFPQSDLKRTTSGSGLPPVPETVNVDLIKKIGTKLFSAIPAIFLGPNNKLKGGLYCSQTNLAHSYIRLNDPDGVKVGGGCRVKKIEFSDEWDVISGNTEDAHTYGQVYDYTTKDENGATISSGVIDYEPLMGGLECPYKVPFVNRHDWKLLPSQDYHYADEPVYEGYIPSGNLIYSKVTVRNIKPSDLSSSNTEKVVKHGTGYVVNEFYTAKDFPIIFSPSPFEHKIKKNWILKLLGKNKTDFGAYQGYSLILNDMHGKPKGNKVFNEYNKPMSSVEYVYQTDPANPSKLMNYVSVIKPNGDIVNNEIIGVDYDVTIDPREVKQTHYDAGIQINIETKAPVIMVVPPFWPRFKVNQQSTRTMSITKIINKRGLIKKVIAHDLEALVETENLLYDSETGEVLLTSVDNEYKDKQYNFKQPAHWAYEGMSGAYKNIGAEVKITLTNGSGTDASQLLYPGDELIDISHPNAPEKAWVVSATSSWGSSNPDAVDYNPNYGSGEVKISTHKNGTEYCTPADGPRTFLIIRSGRRNLSSAPIGEVASMQNPISGNQLAFTKVLASSAVEYTDNWPAFKNLKFSTVFCPLPPPPPPPPCFGCGGTGGGGYDPCLPPGQTVSDPTGLLDNINDLELTDNLAPNGSPILYDRISNRCFYIDDCIVFEYFPCNIADTDEVISEVDEEEDTKDEDENEEENEEENLQQKRDDGMGFMNYNLYENYALNYENKKINGPNVFDELPFYEPLSSDGEAEGSDCNPEIIEQVKFKSCRLLNAHPIKGNQYRFKFELFSTTSCDIPTCTIVFINNRGSAGRLKRSGNYLYKYAVDNNQIPSPDCLAPSSIDSRDYNKYNMAIEGANSFSCAKGKTIFWVNLIGKSLGGMSVSSPGIPGVRSINVRHVDIKHAFKVFKRCKECPEPTDNRRIESSIVLSSKNPYLNGTRGNWRPKISYSYFDISTANSRRDLAQNNSSDLNTTVMRNSGAIKQYQGFWVDPSGSNTVWQKNSNAGTPASPWIATNEVTLVNPNSQELENKNALGIYSAALYSQFQNQAIAVAQNAKYQNILFENFEDYEHDLSFDGNCVSGSGTSTLLSNFSPEVMGFYPIHWPIWTIFNKDKVTPSVIDAHTGITSLKIAEGTFGLCLGEVLATVQGCGNTNVPVIPSFSPEKGIYILDFWAKHNGNDDPNILSMFNECGTFEFKPIGEVIKIDNWRKYSFEVKILANVSGINIKFKNTTGDVLFIDDIRIQPMASEMKGFVYEKLTQRLTAELDANNYATFYEYDEQGNLIRVKKETEKGIITIKENRQNIIK